MEIETANNAETRQLAQGKSPKFFSTEHLQVDLKGRSVRGGAVTIAAQGTQFILRMGSTVILARLLTPQDYGLIAMVTAVTGFVMMFKNMGLSMATIQRYEVNHFQISTLFWINVALSFGLVLVTAALAPVIAWFYGEPRLTWITLAFAGAFVFGGLTVQHQALLRRQMRFGTLALIQISSMVVGIVAAIIAAWYGSGFWALVIMELATEITNMLGVWIACEWRPGLPVSRSGVWEMLAFGGNHTASRILNYLVRNLDNILLGAVWGATSVGLYSKAYALLMLPIRQVNGPLTAVAIPALSSLQNNPDRYRRYYVKAMAILVFLSMPLIVFLLCSAKEVVLIILGQQWVNVVPIFMALAPAAILGSWSVVTGWVFVPLGRTDRQLRCTFFGSTITIISFFIGMRWGALGVAVAFSSAELIKRLPQIIYAYHGTPLKLVDLGRAIWRTALACFAAAIAVITINFGTLVSNLLVRLLLQGLVFVCCYGTVWLIVPGGATFLRETLNLARVFSCGGAGLQRPTGMTITSE